MTGGTLLMKGRPAARRQRIVTYRWQGLCVCVMFYVILSHCDRLKQSHSGTARVNKNDRSSHHVKSLRLVFHLRFMYILTLGDMAGTSSCQHSVLWTL